MIITHFRNFDLHITRAGERNCVFVVDLHAGDANVLFDFEQVNQ